MPLSVTITTEQKVLVSAVPTSDAGNEVKSEEPVVYSVASGSVTLEQAPTPDGVSTFIVSGAAAESAMVTVVSATGAIKDSITVEVTAPGATHFVLSAAAPVAK